MRQQDSDAAFARALGGQRFDRPTKPAVKIPLPATPKYAPVAPAPELPLSADALELGRNTALGCARVELGLQLLLAGRLLVQGVSGAGKSWTLRRILEQSAGRLQQIVVDPEGEFGSLAETLGYILIEGKKLGPDALSTLALRVREKRVSIVLDLYDMDRNQQLLAFTHFVGSLVQAPKEHWTPALVAIDEAHLFAPFGGHLVSSASVRKAAIGALTDLMSRGRKRGLAGVLATQRIARLAKSVVSETQNFLIGLNTLDLDIRRAADAIGWDAQRAFDRLPLLRPGDFVAVGEAFKEYPVTLHVGPVESRHEGAAPQFAPLEAISTDAARERLDVDALVAESEEQELAAAEEGLKPGYKAVRAFIRERPFVLAARIYGALARLAPDGATLVNLARSLEATGRDVELAVDLLEHFHAIEVMGDGDALAARVVRGMLPLEEDPDD